MKHIDLKPIDRQNAADTVIRQLIGLMTTNKLKPGGRLPPESEIASRIGVGRNSVREAMKVLQTLGLVVRRQGDGSYLADSYQMPFDWILFPLLSRLKTSSHLVEFRRVIEMGVADLVITLAEDEDFNRLEQRLIEFESYREIVTDAAEAAVAADIAFHVCIAEITQNPAVIELVRLVMNLFEPSMKAHVQTPQGFSEAIDDHRALYEALRIRDREAVRDAMISSFETWRQYIEL